MAALTAELLVPAFSGTALAVPPQFTQAWVRPDTHKALQHTGLMICATPSAAAGSEASVVLVIPTDGGATDFTVNSTAANWIVDSNNLPSGATFWPGMTSGTTHATTVAGHTITFPSTALTSGTQYCFHITGTSTLTNGSATTAVNITGGTLFTQTSAPATINQTNWSTAVITDNTITVSAVVPPNFSISLSANADAFTGNLDPGNIVSTTGVNVSFTTNAVGGWIAWAKDANTGLFSTTANYTIPSGLTIAGVQQYASGHAAFDLTAGNEGYNMVVSLVTPNPSGCTEHLDPAFWSNTDAAAGGFLNTNFVPIGACTRDTAAPGTDDGDTILLKEQATIRGGTPAGSDYSDVISVVGAGNF